MVEFLPGMQETLGSFPTLGYLRSCLKTSDQTDTPEVRVIKRLFPIRFV